MIVLSSYFRWEGYDLSDGYLTIEEQLSLPVVNSPVISADGKKVAYTVRHTDWDDNKYLSTVVVYDAESGTALHVSNDEFDSSLPDWDPDSKRLAFLQKTGGENKNDVMIFDFEEKRTFKLLTFENDISQIKWSRKNDGLYLVAASPESEELKKRKENYGEFDYIDEEPKNSSLFFVHLSRAMKKYSSRFELPKDMRSEETLFDKLTDGKEFHVSSIALSPDGNHVALLAPPTSDVNDFDKAKVFLMNADKKLKELPLTHPRGFAFSPDSKKLAVVVPEEEDPWMDNGAVEIVDLSDLSKKRVAVKHDLNIELFSWTEKGFFVSWIEDCTISLGLLGEKGTIARLTNEDQLVMASSTTPYGEHLAMAMATDDEPVEIYLDGKKITDIASLHPKRERVRKERLSWKSNDGTEIHGVLNLPADFDSMKKHPLVVLVHGGPTWTALAAMITSSYYPVEQLVSKGVLVLEPNYRGSEGYGRDFRKLNYRNLGIGDYQDVISGVDHLIEKGYVDKDLVGVMGWSQGGYISAFCATYGKRFKAASVGAGISNWMTYHVNTDIHEFCHRYLGNNPWEDPQIYEQTSPMTYIRNASTPTLIQHGGSDTRVPPPNAFELYQGLREMNVPVRLVIYKGMGHGADKPGLHRAIMTQNLAWFSHYLLGEPLEESFKLKRVDREKTEKS
jgi:dipeptidyl aminopeptidase/acylaminoacyl peptidase